VTQNLYYSLLAGDDTYVLSEGFDEIIENSSGTDTIVIPEGYTEDDVSILRMNSSNNMTIMVAGLGQVLVKKQFQTTTYQIEKIEFAETSTVVNMSTISIEQRGGDGNDVLSGITTGASPNDILNGMGGDDTLSGKLGDDTFVFSEGNDLVFDSGGTDTVLFWEGWSPEDVLIYRSQAYGAGYQDLVIADQNGNTLAVDNHFYSASKTIEYVKFYDDTTWDILNMEIETRGTSGNDSIDGGGSIGDASQDDTIYGLEGNDSIWGYSGNDVLDGGSGDDTLNGGNDDDLLNGGDGNDVLRGHSGNDTFIASAGLDAIDEYSGTDTIQYGPGVDLEGLTFSDTGTDDVTIVLNSGTDEIEVLDQRNANSDLHVEKILFDSGFSVNFGNYANWITAANGDGNANTILGNASANTLSGNGGNDEIHGMAGNDTLYGNDGADMIHGGTGDDVLYGGDGLDFLWGGAGQDSFMFEDGTAFNNVDEVRDFSTGDGDALDIEDILDGNYTYGVDAITDFVQITDNGTDSTLYIDQNGGADNFVAVASILGITGLTDEAALESAGTLITV
jgi:Ca2+-binding RTX toxin-like protein